MKKSSLYYVCSKLADYNVSAFLEQFQMFHHFWLTFVAVPKKAKLRLNKRVELAS